ncbi:MAG: dTDP-4-dehydrorhamnose reductase [Sterolibacteriaceae bacterium]|uniref:dTDP-4-dehydrorhamnose reductase n=1 Tax=Candidatus Methylophosphatis roskildensis TaxID=2899263 RepID=A0A9D7E6R6_9PROT|nr:dTDP-4-dehydrorhamnose reductase [Candidatus Methylophosphatis roskildensis]
MKWLVTGRDGQVGWELSRALQPLGEVVPLGRVEADLAVPDSLRDRVLQERPAVIVNAAAYTAVDKAESEPDLAMRINGEAPAELARAARDTGALLIHYSTDYVFDGAKEGSYLEDDLPNPISQYGRSKLCGERAIAESGCRYAILRTQWVFGSHGGNFLRTILRLAGGRECLRIVSDQFGAPTSARLIADVTAQMLGRMAGGELAPDGVYHLAAAGRASWYDYASFVVATARTLPGLAERLKVKSIEPIATADYPLPATRPVNACFDCGKLERAFGLTLPPWQRGVELCLAELAAR